MSTPITPPPANDDTGPAPSGGVAAVDRAIAILKAFDEKSALLTLAELSARTGLYKSTILRLARSLEHAGLLVRLPDGRFRLGGETLRLGTVYQQGHITSDLVLPDMKRLALEFDESVAFYVLEGEERVCLYRINAARVIGYTIRQGDSAPLPTGSAGRVLAAFLGWTDPAFPAIREAMLSYTVAERHPDLASVSVPVFGAGEAVVGTLTIGGPQARINSEFVARARRPMLEAAARVSRALGSTGAALAAAAQAEPA